MKKLITLHTVLSSVFYAVLFEEKPKEDRLRKFEKNLSRILESLPRDEERRIHVKGWVKGMFINLTDGQINGGSMVNTETSDSFYNEDHGSPTILYDYLKGAYIDWAKILDEKGSEDKDFIEASKFSFVDSFKTSLLSRGIPETDMEKVYIFYILNYEPTVPYTLPQELIEAIEMS